MHLALRPHPSESPEIHEALVRTVDSTRLTLAREAAIEDLVCACDAVIVQHSTVALEAALMGRHVILADFSGMPTPSYLERIGASAASDADDVERLLRSLPPVGGDLRMVPAGASYHLGPTDGHAARRVAALVAEMVAASEAA